MKAYFIVLLSVLLSFSSSSFSTTIYKSVDKDGNVSFSQDPSQNSIKMELPNSTPTPATSTVNQEMQQYTDEQNKNMLVKERLSKDLTKINLQLGDLAKAKERADAIVKECMTKPRIRLLDYSKCPEGSVDKSKCVIVNNIPTTPENCRRPSYHEMMKIINKLEYEKEKKLKEIKNLN